MCPDCGQPTASCRCANRSAAPLSGDGIVRVHRETKGRKGKGVTLVKGLDLDADGLKKLAQELKKKCGAGGAVKGGVIEIQGDHRDLVVAELEKHGHTVKKAGG